MVHSDPENSAANTYKVAEVTDDEAISIQPLAEESLKNGDQFIFREVFSRSTTDSDLKIFIEKSSETDDSMRVIGRVIEPNQALEGTISFNVDVDTQGTDFRNANTKVTDPMPEPENMTVQYDGTYTKSGDADALPVEVLGTGEGVNRKSMGVARAAFRLTPGTNVLYDLEAQSDDTTVIVEFIISQRPQIE